VTAGLPRSDFGPSSDRRVRDPRNFKQNTTGLTKHLCIQGLLQLGKPASPHTAHGEWNMKMPVTKMLASATLFATLVAAESAYAQTPYGRELPNAHWDGAPATANDSWESGVAGKRVRVQPDDAIEDGRVVGQDPDPNIRSQLQREYNEGGDGD
jgi:hypothetical protein